MVKKNSKKERDIDTIRKALKTNNQNYYNELMSQYHNSIHFYVNDIIKNQAISNDLTIEIMGKAFINLKSYNFKYAFSTWIFTIAKNHCIDYLRKNNLKTISIDELRNNDEYYFEIPSKDSNPEDLLIKKQRIQLLRRLVNQLSLKYINVVKLRYFKEMSYSEISDKLNLSESTIKIRLYRARKELLKIFKLDDKIS
tara:strand:- start:6368 stop:6958 length:591 start_codon:yes stop_codon:yes gene_type:complete